MRAVLAAPAARSAVLELLRAGCPKVTIDGPAGAVAVQIDDRGYDWIAQPVERVLPILARLRASLPTFAESGRTWRRPVIDWLGPAVGFTSLVGGLALTTLGMLRWEPEASGDLFAHAARIGLPAWAVVAVLFFFLSRGRPGALVTFGCTVAPMLVGLPALVAGGALTINATLDRGPAEMRPVTVLRKEVEDSRSGRQHLLRVESWRSGRGEPERIEVTEAQHGAAREGQRVLVRIRPGRLGWRWMEGWELER